ncbi:DUF1559 family PulG-like putative transporter [Sedimentisphaera salicampi]|uniref:DUF1559 family PulG-like putative transporter n=1 Tax=Sedimentisphaera salicampi TaxID=1941349 RepID=UPI000B9C6646|nr:DUF1559 domain-containing protein [Sedimentisphaera salicampi]OXU15514.1 Pullulanase secretion protein PulG [Sedimentisphaera salicampi]
MKSLKYGFTLIELLVVIAIIAVLMSVLIPSLNKAREAGKRVYCMSNLRSLSTAMHLYADSNDDKIPSGSTEGPYAWVNHAGGYNYFNLDNDPHKKKQQLQAIKRGLLWPYAGGNLDLYLCPTSRKGQARSYSIPDCYAYDNLGILDTNGASESMLIDKLLKVRRPAERMLCIDEAWATPASWSIMYDMPQWWDPVPMRHSMGTNLAFADGHAEYWKWKDSRTRSFAEETERLPNPNDATYWRRVEPENTDLIRLIEAVWGRRGWSGTSFR